MRLTYAVFGVAVAGTALAMAPKRAFAGVPANLLPNGDFSQIDASGNPVGWFCSCQDTSSACSVQSGPSAGAKHRLVLPSGCTAASYFTPARSQQGLRLSLRAKGETLDPHDFAVKIWDVNATESAYATGSRESGWYAMASDAVSTAETLGFAAAVLNNSTKGPISIENVVAYLDGPNPEPKVASLLMAVHHDSYAIKASLKPTEFWLPLPLDYASQVPLFLNLNVTPPTAVRDIRYEQDSYGNWGASVTLWPFLIPGKIAIDWQGLVLVKRITDAERPVVYQATNPPSDWLAASDDVEDSDPGIAATASSLTPGASSELGKMSKIVNWTSKNIKYGFIGNLDASSVFASREGTCTGYANLAAALGRDLDVPTRSIANYLVGIVQQVHSINEFYLGEGKGWRRVEPQESGTVLPEDYGFIIRIVEPTDETSAAASADATKGIPYKTFTEILEGSDHVTEMASDVFAGCPYCFNKAELWQEIRGDRRTLGQAFDLARGLWQRDLDGYLNGTVSREVEAKRRLAPSIRTLSDLQAWLDHIQ